MISTAPPDEDEDDDELSDMDEGDVDAGAAKQLSKKQQVLTPQINAHAFNQGSF